MSGRQTHGGAWPPHLARVGADVEAALGARYTVERQLCGGGASRMLVARDRVLDRQVVVKTLLTERTHAAERERFYREMSVTARLRHPNIVPVLDAARAPAHAGGGGVAYYTMPYLEGESLRERLARDGRLPVPEALRIARELAEALQHTHEQDVVHRDVKPANDILADATQGPGKRRGWGRADGCSETAASPRGLNGSPVLVDFGIACTVSRGGDARITETGLLVGTPAYMSPEQAAGEDAVDGRADIYALGCVLYEMLTGEPPFRGRDDVVLCRRLCESPPRPSLSRRDVPSSVDEAVVRALAPLAGERFSTAGEFGDALDRASRRFELTRGWRLALSTGLAAVVGGCRDAVAFG